MSSERCWIYQVILSVSFFLGILPWGFQAKNPIQSVFQVVKLLVALAIYGIALYGVWSAVAASK